MKKKWQMPGGVPGGGMVTVGIEPCINANMALIAVSNILVISTLIVETGNLAVTEYANKHLGLLSLSLHFHVRFVLRAKINIFLKYLKSLPTLSRVVT